MATQQNTGNELDKSITRYKNSIMNDINLILRITDGEKIYTTHLVQWHEKSVTFFAPIFQRDWVILDTEKDYEIYFIANGNMYRTVVTMSRKYMQHDKLYYTATIASPLIKKQQREHFRLPLLLDLEFQIFPTSEEDYEVTTSKIYKASTINISVGGICIASNEKLRAGSNLYIQLQFLNHPLVLVGNVLNNGGQTPSGTYIYRVRFNNLDRPTESLLSRLIFEKQRLTVSQPNRPLQ